LPDSYSINEWKTKITTHEQQQQQANQNNTSQGTNRQAARPNPEVKFSNIQKRIAHIITF
jgi:hypothetical protein